MLTEDATRRQAPRWYAQALEAFIVFVAGVSLAVELVMTWVWADGYSPSSYNAGNRFAIAVAFVLALAVVPIIAVAGHHLLMRRRTRRRWVRILLPSTATIWALALVGLNLAKNCTDATSAC